MTVAVTPRRPAATVRADSFPRCVRSTPVNELGDGDRQSIDN